MAKDLLIKIDMTDDGLFETAASLQIYMANMTVDVTWTLGNEVGGADCKETASISGSGVFKDESTDEVREIFFDGETPDFQVIVPDFSTIEGPVVSSINYSGA
jgi:predicted secreted protein